MAELLIMLGTTFGCGILFFAIGVYAFNRKDPMWFWAGSEVDNSSITDVKGYNRENGIMWMVYSFCYFVSGATYVFAPNFSVAVLLIGGTVGIAALIFVYKRIYNKYKVK